MRTRTLAVGVFFLGMLSLAPYARAEDTGFIAAPMWLTPSAPADGDMVRLNVLFHNGETSSISGTVLFYDGATLLGKKALTLGADAEGDASLGFRIGAGSHSFSANMSSLTEMSASGVATPLALPLQSAQLSVTVRITAASVSAANAAAADTATSTGTMAGSSGTNTSAILDQVSNAETTALSVVPAAYQNGITRIAQAIDAWRASEAATFSADKADAQQATAAKPASSTAKAAPAQSGATTSSAADGPIAYVELALFTILAFLFSFPVIFYVFGAVLAFVVIRFIVRKIVQFVRERRIAHYRSSAPRSPRGSY